MPEQSFFSKATLRKINLNTPNDLSWKKEMFICFWGGDYQGATPLHYATMFGQEASVNSLLQNNVSVDAQDNNGETPLSCAVSQGSQTIVEMLLGFGADVNLSDKSKATPFMKAAIYG